MQLPLEISSSNSEFVSPFMKMNHFFKQFDTSAKCLLHSRTRGGFTMVELLVAVSILVILTTLTVSAFNVNDADRVSNSIATFKNALEGARSRAINAGEVRGLRLITDANNPRIVKSVVYVGSAEPLEGEVQIGAYQASDNTFAIQEQGSNNDWGPLGDHSTGRRLIRAGSRIEIPRDSGRWYIITEAPTSTSDDIMRVAGLFTPGEWVGTTYREVPDGGNFTYRLELEPTILEGAEPILLDPQTCIDLDGSRIPASWRGVEDDNLNGVIDGSETDANSNGFFDFSTGYSTRMDILFAPDGTLTGLSRTSGVLSFRVAYVSDVILAEQLRQRSLSFDYSTISTYPAFIVPANPEKAHKGLTLFPQTGGVVITDIDPTTSDANNDFNSNVASQPFSFALLGKESN